MNKTLILRIAVLTVVCGCSQLPVNKQKMTGGIVRDGPAEFAIFPEPGHVVAVRLGVNPIANIKQRVVAAIEKATKCRVVGRIQGDDKSFEAKIKCAAAKWG